MSHVAECKTVVKNLEVLGLAAARLGGKLNLNDRHLRWYGQFVDDSTDWRSMFSEQEANRIASLSRTERIRIVTEKMRNPDHTISFPGATYNVGVYGKQDGTFAMRWDYYGGGGGLMSFLGDNSGGRLSQAYAVEAAKRAARLRGYATKEVKGKNGAIQVEVLVR